MKQENKKQLWAFDSGNTWWSIWGKLPTQVLYHGIFHRLQDEGNKTASSQKQSHILGLQSHILFSIYLRLGQSDM